MRAESRSSWLLVTAAFFAAGAAVPSPSAPSDAAEAGGKQTFDHWCAPCHASGPGHPGTQSLEVKYGSKLPAPLEQRSDLTPEVTRYFVRHGVALMPFFRETEISETQLKELAEYLAKTAPAKRR